MGSSVGTIAGGAAGFMLGGPAGAAIGAGLGSSLLGPKTPDAPNYAAAAKATAAGDLKAAQAAAAANRVSQETPYGNLTYSQIGTDAQGNPMWKATQTLSPEELAIYKGQSALSRGEIGAAQNAMGIVQDYMHDPRVDRSKLSQYGINPGENYTDAMMRQMQPQLERDRASLDQQLANQGIGIGSEAYKTAHEQQADAENRARLQAITGGMNVGLAANQQEFGQMQQNMAQPISLINALRGGSQVQGANYVNAPQQATTGGANMLGAAQARGQADIGAYNAQMGSQNAMTSGLFGLGGAMIKNPSAVASLFG